MATAAGIMRVDTEDRLLVVLAELDGFSAAVPPKGSDLFHVIPPPDGTPKARRWLIVGTPDGAFDPDGIQAGADPGFDEWEITCGLVCTDVRDPQTAKHACQTQFNRVADYLAATPRLGMDPGPQGVRPTEIAGPYFAWDPQKQPTAWLNFTIRASCIIERNQP